MNKNKQTNKKFTEQTNEMSKIYIFNVDVDDLMI